MTNEQREAIEYLKESVLIYKNTIPKISDAIDTVLSLIKEQQEEIERLKTDNGNVWQLNANMSKRHLKDICKLKQKDKQIDLMAEYISKRDVEEDICMKNKTNPDWCNEDYTNCQDCIKKYFADLVEKE